MKLSAEDLAAIELHRRTFSAQMTVSSIVSLYVAVVWLVLTLSVTFIAVLKWDETLILIVPLYLLSSIMTISQAVFYHRGDPASRLILTLAERAVEEDARADSPADSSM